MNAQELFLLALLLELICDEMLSKYEREVLVFFRSISQEVPARAVDDADVQVRQTYLALCLKFKIEKFTQFIVSSCFNHVL